MKTRHLLATVMVTVAMGAFGGPLLAAGSPASAAVQAQVAPARTETNDDGRKEQFKVGTNNAVYHRWERTAGRGDWSGWDSLGGNVIQGDLGVAKNSDGRLEVFVTATNNELYHKWQVSPGGSWIGGWVSMGGMLISSPSAGRVGASIHVVAEGGDGQLHLKKQLADGTWSGWLFPGQ